MTASSEGESSTPPRKWAPRLVVRVVSAALLLVLGGGLFYVLQPHAPVDPQVLANEARVNVLRLCADVQSYRDEHGVFLAAGPVPAEVPRGGGPVPFEPDENMKRLGFNPGERVHCQYQVVVQETPLGEAEVTCFARGDRDGDGQVSVYRVTLDANGMTSAVQVEREDE